MKYFSWNRYLTYRNCPLRYKNIYILRKERTVSQDDYHFLYGSVMHSLVESFYKNSLWEMRKECVNTLRSQAKSFYKNLLRESKVLWHKPHRKSQEELLEEILNDVPKITAAIKKYRLLSKLVFPEQNLRADLSGYKIGGRTDLILHRQEGLTLIDGKGSKNKSDDHREQVLFYALSYYLAYKKIPKFSGVWYFRETQIDWHAFKIEDLKRLSNLIITALKAIEQEKFEVTSKRDNCFWCEYKNTCSVHEDHLDTPYGKVIEAFL